MKQRLPHYVVENLDWRKSRDTTVLEDSLLNIAFAIVRIAAFIAGGFLFGLPVICLTVLKPSVDGELGELPPEARRRLGARLEGLLQASIWAAGIGTVIAIVLQAVVVADLGNGRFGTNSVVDVLESSFGKWYLLRIPLLIGLAILLLGKVRELGWLGLRNGRSPSPMWWVTWLVMALGLVSTNSFSGHASVSSPLGAALANDIVHLASGSIWFAGIVILSVVVPDVRRSLESQRRAQFVGPLVVRFSSVALTAIGLAALTGTLNSLFNVKAFEDLYSTGYGGLLTAKISAFLVVLALGAVNHFYVRRRFAAALAGTVHADPHALFKRTIAMELTMALAIFSLTGALAGSARTRESALGKGTIEISRRI